jgi:Na+-driven multidrug efflux pump
MAAGKTEEARDKIADTLFHTILLGLIGTALLVISPCLALFLVLPNNAPVFSFSSDFLRLRSLCMVPELISATKALQRFEDS